MNLPIRRLMIDITHTAAHDYNTGIQRVARCLAREAIEYSKKTGTQVECFPVILVDGQFVHVDRWCIARGFRKSNQNWSKFFSRLNPIDLSRFSTPTQIRLNQIGTRLRKLFYPRTIDRKIRQFIQSQRPKLVSAEPGPGDVILMPDSWWDLSDQMFPAIENVRSNGALVGAMVHDLIPIRHPEFFDEELRDTFNNWAQRLVRSVDFFVGDAQAAEDDLWRYIQEQNAPLGKSQVGHVRLGCDIGPRKVADASRASTDVRRLFDSPESAPYLMVSTIEIRKNHNYLIDAFEHLWAQNHDVSLVLVGRIGWKCDDVVERIVNHPESGKRLHLLSNVDDKTLNYIYQNSKAFIFPSKAEGFGLPIVEAQHHGLHVFASDIPIFREVAGAGAAFFDLKDPAHLSQQLVQFESNEGWTMPAKIEVVNEPWKLVFPKLVDVVSRLATNVEAARSADERQAA
ncbi:glycosyltransferase [bacterium]|nr:glycosyltransferase [bacterium]